MMNLQSTWTVWRLGNTTLRVDRRVLRTCLILLILLAVTVSISLSYGDYPIAIAEVFKTLLGGGDSTQKLVVWELRLPRIATALLVGMAMAVSGAMLQGLTRNPLADPGIIGINQGAAVAAVAVLVWFDNISIHWLPAAAFAGGTVTAMLIYLVAWKDGSSPVRLVLVGIGFAAFASALTTLMVVFSDIERVGQAYLWLSGSVYGRSWDNVFSLLPWIVVLLPLAYGLSLPLNAMLQNDDSAKALGLDIERLRLLFIIIAVALASASVSAAGIFSFLGLVAPHLSRLLVGATYQGLLPVTALVGACIVVGADLIGRSVIAPNQIPAGLVTAMIGAPYFFWRMRQHYGK